MIRPLNLKNQPIIKFSFLIACYLVVSCKKESNAPEYCANSLEYKCNKFTLTSDVLKLHILDKQNYIFKRFKSKQIDNVLFFGTSIKEEAYFVDAYLIPSKDSLTVQFGSGYFRPEYGRKQWTSKEVENLLLKDSIGLVLNKDTIIIRKCR